MAFIDQTAVTVALPAIQSSLGVTATAHWEVADYTLFLALLVLVAGSQATIWSAGAWSP
jgi:hypothetical protein